MKRDENLIPLSRQHHTGLILAQLIKKDAPEYRALPIEPEGKRKYVLQQWETELEPHFKLEENILFPILEEEQILLEDVKELKEQHKEIKRFVHLLEEKEDVVVNLDKLGHLLEAHIRKEEREVFQKAQDQLPEKRLKEVGNLLKEHIK